MNCLRPVPETRHERLDLKHAPGRIAKYLETPLHANTSRYLQELADRVLDGDVTGAMRSNVDHLTGEVERLAPIDYNDLPRSGHPTVTSEGATVYDRPPEVPRLSEAQLRAKARAHPDYRNAT